MDDVSVRYGRSLAASGGYNPDPRAAGVPQHVVADMDLAHGTRIGKQGDGRSAARSSEDWVVKRQLQLVPAGDQVVVDVGSRRRIRSRVCQSR